MVLSSAISMDGWLFPTEWRDYFDNPNDNTRNTLVELYYPRIVRPVVAKKVRRLPDYIEADDLESHGGLVLTRAVELYEPKKGTLPRSYLEMRVRKGLNDQLRTMDWMKRGARKNRRAYEDKNEKFLETHGYKPTAAEVAAEFGYEEDDAEFRKLVYAAGLTQSSLSNMYDEESDHERVGHGEELVVDHRHRGVDHRAGALELVGLLIRGLPMKQFELLYDTFGHGKTLREKGVEIGVGESRATKIRARAIRRAREILSRDVQALKEGYEVF